MMPTTLEKVMSKKKRLAKEHPSWDNSRLLKEAWKPFKGKVSGVKKKASKKRKVSGVKKKAAPKRRSVGTVKKKRVGSARPKSSGRKKLSGIGAIKQQAREAKKELDTKLGEKMVKQYNATTKMAKRKVGKEIAEIKKSITSVKKIINKK
jgi:hypothetical protein